MYTVVGNHNWLPQLQYYVECAKKLYHVFICMQRKFTAFLGTRSRSSFEAELAADAIAAQILTSVPASLVPSMFNSGEDAAETGRKRTCVSPEGGQNANTATAAPANEQGSATASAEMSAEKNAGACRVPPCFPIGL